MLGSVVGKTSQASAEKYGLCILTFAVFPQQKSPWNHISANTKDLQYILKHKDKELALGNQS
jgi:hypothetical protein